MARTRGRDHRLAAAGGHLRGARFHPPRGGAAWEIGRASCRERGEIWEVGLEAEDGIRDLIVTGVQTCALPILPYRETRCWICCITWNTGLAGPSTSRSARLNGPYPRP